MAGASATRETRGSEGHSRHAVAHAAVVLVATAIGQATVLVGHSGVIMQPDSASYVQYAHQLRHLHFTDTFRTPGYPAVLAVFGTTGTVVLQIVLVSAVPFLVWVIARRAFASAVAAVAVGAVAGLDVYAIQWERVVGTESIAYVSILVWAGLLLLVLRGGRRSVFAAGALAAWLVLLRPIFLPVLLVAIAAAAVRVRYRAALMAACALVPVVVLTLANGVTHHTWAMSNVAGDAVIGKVLRYDMQRHHVPARFRAIEDGVRRMRWDGTVASLSRAAPDVSLATTRAWAMYVATHHPIEYGRKSLAELVDVWLLKPRPYTQWPDTPLSALGLIAVIAAYAMTPVALAVAALRKDVFVGALAVSVAAVVLILAFDEYIDFDRVRMPVDAIALLALAGTAVSVERIRRAPG